MYFKGINKYRHNANYNGWLYWDNPRHIIDQDTPWMLIHRRNNSCT